MSPLLFYASMSSRINKKLHFNVYLIEFNRIKGGKAFDINEDWFVALYKQISSTI